MVEICTKMELCIISQCSVNVDFQPHGRYSLLLHNVSQKRKFVHNFMIACLFVLDCCDLESCDVM